MGTNPGGDDPHLFQHPHFNPDLFPKKRGSSSTPRRDSGALPYDLILWYLTRHMVQRKLITGLLPLLGPQVSWNQYPKASATSLKCAWIWPVWTDVLGEGQEEADIESNFILVSYPQHTGLKKKKVFSESFSLGLFSPHIGISPCTHLLFREPVREVRPAHPSRHPKKSKETFKIVSIHHQVSNPLTRTTTAPYNSWNTGLSPSLVN